MCGVHILSIREVYGSSIDWSQSLSSTFQLLNLFDCCERIGKWHGSGFSILRMLERCSFSEAPPPSTQVPYSIWFSSCQKHSLYFHSKQRITNESWLQFHMIALFTLINIKKKKRSSSLYGWTKHECSLV